MQMNIIKTFVLMLYTLVVLQVSCYASMMEWTDNMTFLYGMNIYDVNGSYLPDTMFSINYLREGLTIEVTNGMPYSDQFMLLFLLNGHLQPYYIDDIKSEYGYYEIDASSTIEIKVWFNEVFIVDSDVQYLHVITIGLLNQIPENQYDSLDGYSNMCTLPFYTHEPANTTIDILTSNIKMSDSIKDSIGITSNMICFYDYIGTNCIYYPPYVHGTIDSSYETNILCTGDDQVLSILVIVDNIPCVRNDLSTLCYRAEYGYAYDYNISFNGIGKGIHQIYAISCPVFDCIVIPATTAKISITVYSE